MHQPQASLSTTAQPAPQALGKDSGQTHTTRFLDKPIPEKLLVSQKSCPHPCLQPTDTGDGANVPGSSVRTPACASSVGAKMRHGTTHFQSLAFPLYREEVRQSSPA